ncbi:MAG TPA: flagellar protein FliT [Ramlibacter sp.]|uniref:flagellar protein FliT n=1 Tax=Ramlibacter sp. TaxID=1917967 RepID=UPI002ED4D89A
MGASASHALAAWSELAARVTLMVELARAGRWERLPELDAHCAALYRGLQEADAEALGDRERALALELALRVRARQEELQNMTRPQLLQLRARMDELQPSSAR